MFNPLYGPPPQKGPGNPYTFPPPPQVKKKTAKQIEKQKTEHQLQVELQMSECITEIERVLSNHIKASLPLSHKAQNKMKPWIE
jgi:hypothetical protein